MLPNDDGEDDGHPVMTAPSFALVTFPVDCWDCQRSRLLTAIWVPRFTETQAGQVTENSEPAMLMYAWTLDAQSMPAILREAPWLRAPGSAGARRNYFINHCPHCDAAFGDYYLFGAEGALCRPKDWSHLAIRHFDWPLQAQSSFAQDDWMAALAPGSTVPSVSSSEAVPGS